MKRVFAFFSVATLFFAPQAMAQVVSPTPTPTILQRCDINHDGFVDSIDFGILAENYGKTTAQLTYPYADIDGNGVVDIIDVSWFASNYGM